MLLYAFLFLFYLSSGVESFDFESLNGDDFEVIDPYVGEGRFFGNVSNLFSTNSSLISIVAIFIGGIILFGQNLFFL